MTGVGTYGSFWSLVNNSMVTKINQKKQILDAKTYNEWTLISFMVRMTTELKMVKTEIQLPGDILYSQGIDKERMGYFVIKNFLLELYREGKISLGRMATLLGANRIEMLGIMKDLNVPLNYGLTELEEDIKTAKKLGIINESSQ